jgi:DMSO/TMAO reductase YedYZ molybdopterin-dependent catalytic subunit
MSEGDHFYQQHLILARRHFLNVGAGFAVSALGLPPDPEEKSAAPELAQALANLESYLTPQERFQDVSRGQPLPHSLSEEKKCQVGLTRDTWKLEVISDPDHPAAVAKQLTCKDGTALDFNGLLRLGDKHAVRVPKVMTCLNIGCPLGMGIWEGVPLREIVWLTEPRANFRRVAYYGYHNDDPKQIFRSTLPAGRVLEDTYDMPPVILCYKLNGAWLQSKRGGPVRVVVPEAYGFKSVKWLTHVVLSNLAHANDTYADANNDIDTSLKTFAATILVPSETKRDVPFAVTGYAQVGISGLSKVQVWVQDKDKEWPRDDKYFANAPWRDAAILSPPKHWGGNLPGERIPGQTIGFDPKTNEPRTWPLRFTKVHWAALIPGLRGGEYLLRCRTIDEKGLAQPMPRPFRKSGHCDIQSVNIKVNG